MTTNVHFTSEDIEAVEQALGSRYTLVRYRRFSTREEAEREAPLGLAVRDGPFKVVKRGGSADPHYLVVYDHHSNEN